MTCSPTSSPSLPRGRTRRGPRPSSNAWPTSARTPTPDWGPEQLAAALKPYGVPTGRQVWGKTPDGKGANRRGIHRDDITKAVTQSEKKRGDSPAEPGSEAARPSARPR